MDVVTIGASFLEPDAVSSFEDGVRDEQSRHLMHAAPYA
jgi:hypothetical protein